MTEADISDLQEQNYQYRIENEALKHKKQVDEARISSLEGLVGTLRSNAEIAQIEKANLERRIDALHKRIANAEHEKRIAGLGEIKNLRDQVCTYSQNLEKAKIELKHVKRLLFERNRRYQEDCITINRLNVTIDVLIGRIKGTGAGS